MERETLYLAMEYTTFFLGKAAAVKPLFDLLLGPVTIPADNLGNSSVISTIQTNAEHRLNARINITFAIGKKTSRRDSLGVRKGGIFYHIFLPEDKSIAEWQDASTQMVATAMSEYVSKVCFFFFNRCHPGFF